MRCGDEGGGRPCGIVGLSLLAGLLVLGAPAPARAQEEVVRLGDLPAISNAAIYLAMERGFFKELGLRVELSSFASAAKMLPALAAGELDVSVGTPSAGLFNAVAEGAPYRVVADKGQFRAGHGYATLTVRKDLVATGQVKSVKDLKGRKIAQTAKGIILDYIMDKMAAEAGLGLKDFAFSYLTAPNQMAALESKTIDAAITTEPWGARAEERGVGVRFRTPDQVKGLSPVQAAVIIYSGRFIKDRRPVAQRWMDAYLKGCEFYAARGVQDPEVLAIVEKYTKVPAKAIKAATPFYLDGGGRVNVASLADMIQWFVANGYMPKAVPADQVVDLSFLR